MKTSSQESPLRAEGQIWKIKLLNFVSWEYFSGGSWPYLSPWPGGSVTATHTQKTYLNTFTENLSFPFPVATFEVTGGEACIFINYLRAITSAIRQRSNKDQNKQAGPNWKNTQTWPEDIICFAPSSHVPLAWRGSPESRLWWGACELMCFEQHLNEMDRYDESISWRYVAVLLFCSV